MKCKLCPFYPRECVLLPVRRRLGGIPRESVWALEERSEPQNHSFQSSNDFDQSLCVCWCRVCKDFAYLNTECLVQRNPTVGFFVGVLCVEFNMI